MEGGLIEQRTQIVGRVTSKVIKKKKVRRRSSSTRTRTRTTLLRREVPICVGLQQLYSYCKKVFNGPGVVPPPQDVQYLCAVLDSMKPEDLGLRKDLPFFKPGSCVKENPSVTYTTVYRCQNFSLVLFLLPASAVIPLHNHPEMTVFSKLLLGTMHIKAYDWADPVDEPRCEQPSSLRLAKLKENAVFTAPCDTTVLYPTSGGNIHAFTAITPCAVLDVLGPPYSKEDGRDCTYYKDTLYISPDMKSAEMKDDEQTYGFLEEIEVPEQSKMNGIEYLGPRIIETAN